MTWGFDDCCASKFGLICCLKCLWIMCVATSFQRKVSAVQRETSVRRMQLQEGRVSERRRLVEQTDVQKCRATFNKSKEIGSNGLSSLILSTNNPFP